eukprot:5667460-Lingulodinium_polyedra.AAC.1
MQINKTHAQIPEILLETCECPTRDLWNPAVVNDNVVDIACKPKRALLKFGRTNMARGHLNTAINTEHAHQHDYANKNNTQTASQRAIRDTL